MARRFTGKELPELGSWVRVLCKSNKARDRAAQDAPALVTSVSSHEGDMVCSVVYPNELVLRGFVKGSPVKTLKGIAVSTLRKITDGEVPALEKLLLKSLTMLKSQQEAEARKRMLEQSQDIAILDKSPPEADVKKLVQEAAVIESVQEPPVDKSIRKATVQDGTVQKSFQQDAGKNMLQQATADDAAQTAAVRESVHEAAVGKPTPAVSPSCRVTVAASNVADAAKCRSLPLPAAPLSSRPSARDRSRSPRTPAPQTPPRKTVLEPSNTVEKLTKLAPDRLRLFTVSASRLFQGQCYSPPRISKQDLASRLKADFNSNEIDVGMKELEDRNKIMIFEDMIFRV